MSANARRLLCLWDLSNDKVFVLPALMYHCLELRALIARYLGLATALGTLNIDL